MEFPEVCVKGLKKPDELEFTSGRKGFQRFVTKDIKRWAVEIEIVEENIKDHLVTFTQGVFKKFYEYQKTWDKFVSCLAELDFLVSMAYLSLNGDSGDMCRP